MSQPDSSRRPAADSPALPQPADARGPRQTVGLIQMSCSTDKAQNIAKASKSIEEAAHRGATLICLQELFCGPYPCQSENHRQFELAEPIPGPTTEILAEVAAKHRLVVVASIFERRAAGLYHNTAVVFDEDGSTAGIYRKMHIPDDPLYYEKFYFTPGDLGFPTFATAAGQVGTCVCWDQWFPEAARLMGLAGAEILFFPTAIGWHLIEKAEYGVSQHSAWETMIRSHAIANGMFVAAVNRVGLEGELEFWGASLIVDPNGNILARGSHDQEEILLAECDFSQIDAVRTHWPFFRDRRIDAYADLSKRYLR